MADDDKVIITQGQLEELEEAAGHKRRNGRIKPWLEHQLIRDLATGEKPRAQLAKEHGVGRQAISEFAKRRAREIDETKATLADEFAGLWAADKVNRIAMYQRDLEMSYEGGYSSHYEQIRSRTAILRAIAEELGQLPPRVNIAVAAVAHVLEGVDPEILK